MYDVQSKLYYIVRELTNLMFSVTLADYIISLCDLYCVVMGEYRHNRDHASRMLGIGQSENCTSFPWLFEENMPHFERLNPDL